MKNTIIAVALLLACMMPAGAQTLEPTQRMGLVSIPVASMRTRGAHAGELDTQGIMGMPVAIVEETDDWFKAMTPDGYSAWVPKSSIAEKTPEQMAAWRADKSRYVVKNLWQPRAFRTSNGSSPRDVVTELVLGAIVQTDGKVKNGRRHIILPDGRTAWADASYLQPIAEWADQPFDAEKILQTAYSLEGSPYLWGGTSNKSVDCSGLVKVSYLNNGIILKRNASQQAKTGTRQEADQWPSYQAADLLFFGNSDTQKVTHVGLYDANGNYVHSSGRVKRNSLDPKSESYIYSPLWSVRIHGNEGTDGITRAINHHWYF